jgi:hypothetical protein
MTKINQAFKIVNKLTWKRKHQTMFVIVSNNVNSEKFLERSNRFITSLNGSETIKADVFILSDGNLIHIDDGENWRAYSDALNTKSGDFSNQSIRDFAKECGYVQFSILESSEI